MATLSETARAQQHTRRRGDTAWLLAISGAVMLLHLLTNGRYGFHRDELQFLSDARHLAWGFVAFPPLTPFVERISLELFGLNLVGLRLFSVLAQSAAIVLTGLMARQLGGGRVAQLAAALSVALSGLPLFNGTEFQYTSFAFLWWVLLAYFVIRLLKSENPRWWLAVGAVAGVGLMTKYAILFFIAGILGGFLLTRARRLMASRYFAAALALTVLICLPNLIWQVQHQFISYTFLQHIHVRDVGEGRAEGFWRDQFLVCTNLFAAPLWIAGLAAALIRPRWRPLAWMYIIPVAMFAMSQGRGYYTAGAYPMMMAMGAAACERWLGSWRRGWRIAVEALFFAGVAFGGAWACAVIIPLAGSGPLMRYALSRNGNLREEIGWNQLVRTVAQIRDSLTPEQQAHLGITTGNYGEYGAIEILGPAYRLPQPIGTTNSEWLWGYPANPPTTIIALGIRPDQANQLFTNCRVAGHNGNAQSIPNEESTDHPWIFLCGPARIPWTEIWKEHRDFG